MRILFAGYLGSQFETSWQRFDTLCRLGHDVVAFDQTAWSSLRQRRWRRHLDGEAFRLENVAALNARLTEAAEAAVPELIWIEKGLLVLPEIIRRFKQQNPNVRVVAYQDDNPFGARDYEVPFWRHFVDGLPDYDLHFVKRPSDVTEFMRRGARRTEIFTTGAYEPIYGRESGAAPDRFRYEVAFVGTALDHRPAFVAGLLRRGVPLTIHGRRWNRHWSYYVYRRRFRGPLAPSDYAETLWRTKVNLSLVSHSNCDEYNGRSFDIPASAGFLLAERTQAHQGFYEEGREAEFFETADELIDKTHFYLANEPARRAIALRGYERTKKDGYSLQRRMRDAIATVQTLW
jgi:spore maturation protein CgeB